MRLRSPLAQAFLAALLAAAPLSAWGCGSTAEPVAPAPAATPGPAPSPPNAPASNRHDPKDVAAGTLTRTGPHGAMPSNEQIPVMDRLVPPDTAFGPGIDPLLWQIVVPADNGMSALRVALGKKLYFETRLSKDGTVSCATCHDASRAFTDRRPVSEGIGAQLGRRNAPTTMNVAFLTSQFLDGRAASLEEQAKLPIVNSIEMGQPTLEAAVAAIASDPEYQRMFLDAYGSAPNGDDLARAIAAFERTLVFLDSPVDRFLAGQVTALDEPARRGLALFLGKARCVGCHHLSGVAPAGTNNKFHNIGVSARHQDFEALAGQALAALEKDDSQETMDELALKTDLSELGRFVVTRHRNDIGAFKTMQLRNVGVTAPYMHDGSMQTLWDVMDHYNKGGEPNPFLDGAIEPLALTNGEVDDLVAFMFALSDVRFSRENEEERRRQRALAERTRPFRDDARAKREVLLFEPRKRSE
jgi:cytochrome c peroxidase